MLLVVHDRDELVGGRFASAVLSFHPVPELVADDEPLEDEAALELALHRDEVGAEARLARLEQLRPAFGLVGGLERGGDLAVEGERLGVVGQPRDELAGVLDVRAHPRRVKGEALAPGDDRALRVLLGVVLEQQVERVRDADEAEDVRELGLDERERGAARSVHHDEHHVPRALCLDGADDQLGDVRGVLRLARRVDHLHEERARRRDVEHVDERPVGHVGRAVARD